MNLGRQSIYKKSFHIENKSFSRDRGFEALCVTLHSHPSLEVVQGVLPSMEAHLPFSLGVIASLLNGAEEVARYGGGPDLACLNRFREWQVFATGPDSLLRILTFIEGTRTHCRVVIAGFDSLQHLPRGRFHIEDLMVRLPSPPRLPVEGVRAATVVDIPHLARLQREYCQEEVTWKPYQLPEQDWARYYAARGMDEVYVLGNPPVAKLEIVARYAKHARMGRVYTAVESRRQGLAEHCLRGFLAFSDAAGLTLSLTVRQDNQAAKALYTKAGFGLIGQVVFQIFEGGGPC